jgi:hypothetical protein
MSDFLSLTPNFSRVSVVAGRQNRFNGLPVAGKPLKRLNHREDHDTRLKPGVNEKCQSAGRPLCE